MNKANESVWCWVLGPAYTVDRAKNTGLPVSAYCTPSEILDHYRCGNVAFFPGDARYAPETFAPVSACDRVMAEVYHMSEDGLARGAELSGLSKRVPNVCGAIIDDFSSAVARGKETRQEGEQDTKARNVAAEKREEMRNGMERLSRNIKSVNPSLPLYAVCYTMHFNIDLAPYLPYVDKVSLWVWVPSDLAVLDTHVARAAELYRKPIHLGLYVFDYSALDYGRLDKLDWKQTLKERLIPMKTLEFQFKRAREYLRDGRIEGIHILGSYLRDELKTDQARWVRDFVGTL